MSSDPWTDSFVAPGETSAGNQVVWARNRRADCTYAHRSFALNMPTSRDHGQPARFICKVFDETEPSVPPENCEEYVLATTPGGRKQIKLLVAREAGRVKDLRIEKVPTRGDATKMKELLRLDRAGAARLIQLIRTLDYIPVDGDKTLRLDDDLIREVLADPAAIQTVYQRDPNKFRRLIEDDASARDLVALAHRRDQLARFRRLLADPDLFAEQAANAGGREAMWQSFLEENPWILGISLAGQLLTSWNDEKLEQVVAGFSIAGSGKRADALMRTAGRIRSMVFAEIKHHQTALLGDEYRSGCWSPSREMAGGVVQAQQTVQRAITDIGQRLPDTDDQGAETGYATYLLRPRSFLILGHLDQLRGSGGVHRTKHQSFELYRRNLYEPEILTFDELLARAEWHVTTAEQDRVTPPSVSPDDESVPPPDDPWATAEPWPDEPPF